MTRPIAPEDLFRFRFVVAADLSPDATQVVFAQTRIASGEDEDDDEVEHTDLHLLDVESGNVRRLTFSDSTNSAPAISPDGATGRSCRHARRSRSSGCSRSAAASRGS